MPPKTPHCALIALGAENVLRATDLIGRVGGEEFAVFLPHAGQQLKHLSAQNSF
jgi:GGDEF domain-containing protein